MNRLRPLILLLLFAAFPAAAEHFVSKDVSDGLGNRKAYQVCQDADGYLWFYTQSSIDRYDGFEFRHYVLEPEATQGDFLATANTLVLDRDGVLHVVQTNGRVYRYNKEKDRLEPAFTDAHGHLLALLFDGADTWLGTSEGLVSLGNSTIRLKDRNIECLAKSEDLLYMGTDAGVYVQDTDGVHAIQAIPAVEVTALLPLEDGRIFVGTFSNGAFCYQSHSDRCEPLPDPFPSVPVRKIIRDSDLLLFGTDGSGIVVFDLRTNSITGLIRSEDLGEGLCANTVSDLLLDRNGILWVSTTTDGICFLDREQVAPQWIRHIPGDGNSLISNHVNTILEDSRGNIWFGTNQGLCRFDGSRWHRITQPEGADVVLTLAEDDAGRIWAGGYGFPVFSVDKGGRTDILDRNRFHYCFSLSVHQGQLWIGGLNDTLTAVDLHGGSSCLFPETNIWDLFAEKSMWVASQSGLGQVAPADTAIRWIPLPEGAHDAWCITQDTGGRIWTGLAHGEILCFDPADGSIRHFPLDGTVFTILQAEDGKIWATTGDRIYRLDPDEGKPLEMNRFLGIGSGEFNHTAATRLRDGRFLFGTANGVLAFDPSKIPDGNMAPIVPQLTAFRLLTGDTQRILKDQAIENYEAISLRSGERSFELSFSARAFTNQARIRFDYELEGYDPGPRSSFSAGTVEYTSVPAGRYIFMVKAIDVFTGDVLGERKLRIHVLRPPLLSNAALGIYLVLAILAAWLLGRMRRREIRRQMTQERLDTFIRFAHELKTPVSLIRAPLSVLEKDGKLPQDEQESVSTAIRNTDRLMNMINSLLDLREETGEQGHLQLAAYDLRDYLGETLDAFQPLVKRKGISLDVQVADGLDNVVFDREKMDRIVQNLVSNAVKYTENGSVTVSASPAGKMWKLCVKDTGIGIPAAVRSRIFNGGVRAANARDVDETGYGIGLMITRQLVTLHRGSISLESEEGSGSQFTLLFPLEYKSSEGSLVPPEIPDIQPSEQASNTSRPRILIVEDDAEMLRFLKDYLSADFDTATAPDGDSAIRMADELQPDLILSDVIMPGMNGYDLCRTLKSTLSTSHIPVILLTAMDDREHIILGLESGSDDYILKPFDPLVLSARISNLLHERERLRTLILRSGRERKQREYTNRLDKEFMEKVLAVVENSYMDSEFQIDDLCRSLAMSRTAFFNKLKALAGTGPNDFIRIYRLEKAGELLQSGEFTIAEVADRVGFSDAKYFSSCFKRYFGVSPSKY